MTDNANTSSADQSHILEQIREGKYREALVASIQEHGSDIGQFCMAILGDQTDAEDALTEVFISFYDTMPSMDDDDTVRLRLFEIARRTCARRVEARGERKPPYTSDRPTAIDVDAFDQAVDKLPFVRWMHEALEHLRPSERDSLILHFQAGLNYEEIGRICQKEETVAIKQTSKALLRLRTYLKDKVVV
jgi:RNA polymerase sigma-70 factor (ECF subfamily)